MNRSTIRLVAGILTAFVLVTAAVGGLLWWKISGLKQEMVRQLGKAIGAQVEISSLELDFWNGEMHAAGLTLTNQRPSAPWENGNISQATVHFHPLDIFASTLPISVDVSSWNIILHSFASDKSATPSIAPSDASAESAEPVGPSSSAASRVQVTKLSAQEGSVEIDLSGDRKVQIRGVNFEAENNGAGVWTTALKAESIEAGSLQAGASSLQIRAENDKLTFSDLSVSCSQGFVTGDGEADMTGDHHLQLTLKATEIPISMLVATPWQVKLSGFITGNLTYDGRDDSGSAKGQFAVDHARFNVMPWLAKVTSLVNLPDISDVDLDQATTDFTWKDGTLHLTNLDVRKTDVMRVSGTVDVDPTGNVDGKLKLGLPSAITGKWPSLQAKVFPFQQDDYNWADVHLTGTSDHLQEDLTGRLLAATLQEGVQDSGSLINQATQKATDLLKNILGN